MNAHGRYIMPCRGLSYTYHLCVCVRLSTYRDYYMPLRGLSAVVRLDCWAREKACDLWDGQQSESHAFFVEV